VHKVIHVQYLKTEHRGLIVVHKVVHVQYLKTEHTVNGEGSPYMQGHLIFMLIRYFDIRKFCPWAIYRIYFQTVYAHNFRVKSIFFYRLTLKYLSHKDKSLCFLLCILNMGRWYFTPKLWSYKSVWCNATPTWCYYCNWFITRSVIPYCPSRKKDWELIDLI